RLRILATARYSVAQVEYASLIKAVSSSSSLCQMTAGSAFRPAMTSNSSTLQSPAAFARAIAALVASYCALRVLLRPQSDVARIGSIQGLLVRRREKSLIAAKKNNEQGAYTVSYRGKCRSARFPNLTH
ncbi:MAG TPA: hypothetical protein VE131_14550, partial [Terriglobales bacterium]|nr:hypothetical protein [Terriglobales bacterium]